MDMGTHAPGSPSGAFEGSPFHALGTLIDAIPINTSVPLQTIYEPLDQQQVLADHKLALYIATIPGNGAPGPNVMTRVSFAFQSGLDEEVTWALSTLVSLTGDPNCKITLKENPYLTEELLLRMAAVVETGAWVKRAPAYALALDAALSLRNLCQDISNAMALSQNPKTKPLLLAVISKDLATVSGHELHCAQELARYAVDIVEAVSSFYPAAKNDEMFLTLMRLLSTANDKALVVSLLRSLARLMVTHSSKQGAGLSCGDDVTSDLLDQVTRYLQLLEPYDDLTLTAMDFLYQYVLTPLAEADSPSLYRMANVLKGDRLAIVLSYLPRLLVHNFPAVPAVQPLRLLQRVQPQPPAQPPAVPKPIIDELLALAEPLRASEWMRCVYEPSHDGSVTQISLWKCYESSFSPFLVKEDELVAKLLPAVDFIKNVNNAFPNSNAMVINLPNGQRKFIIKGIQARQFAVSLMEGDASALAFSTTELPEAENRDDVPPRFVGVSRKLLPAGIQRQSTLPEKPTVPVLDEISVNAALLTNVVWRYLVEQKDSQMVMATQGFKNQLQEVWLKYPILLDQLDVKVFV